MGGVLEVQNLHVRYGSREALKGVTFTLEGGAVGLLGPNGAGKTTLIRAVLGLVPPSSGSVSVFEGGLRRRAGTAARDRVGYVPEREGVRPGLSGVGWVALLGEISGLPRNAAVERAHEALRFVGLGESRYRNVETYSTGMQQRLKLAAALVHDPDLVLLDEPTAGMDPVGREEMLGLLKDLVAAGKTLLLSTHILKDVEAVCSRVLILHRGLLLEDASVEDWTKAERQPILVQWEGDGEAFAGVLRQAGYPVERVRGGLYRVVLPAGDTLKSLFTLGARVPGAISRLIRETTSLEEVFLEALHRNGEGGHAGL